MENFVFSKFDLMFYLLLLFSIFNFYLLLPTSSILIFNKLKQDSLPHTGIEKKDFKT
jgi:hypothetical protein